MPVQQLMWDGFKWQGYNIADVNPGGSTDPGSTDRDSLVLGAYKPDATTTGTIPGIMLTDVNTITIFTQSGTATSPYLVQNKRFLQQIKINNCKYITFKNCAFYGGPGGSTGNSDDAIVSTGGLNQNIVFEDCLITATNPTTEEQVGVQGGHNTKFLRCEFTGTADCIALVHSFPSDLNGANSTNWPNPSNAHDGPMNLEVYGCYFHDLAYFSPEPSRAPADNASHSDCIQIRGGSNIKVRYNTFVAHLNPSIGAANHPSVDGTDGSGNPIHISGNKYYPDMNATSVMMVSPYLAPFHDVYFENNWVDGGAYSLNLADVGKAGNTDSNFNVRNNKWGRSMRSGPQATVIARTNAATSGVLINTGNTYEDDGTSANFRGNGGA